MSNGLYHVAIGIALSTFFSYLYSMLIWRRIPQRKTVLAFPCCIVGAFGLTILLYSTFSIIFAYALILICILLLIGVIILISRIVEAFSGNSSSESSSGFDSYLDDTLRKQREEDERYKRNRQLDEINRIDKKLRFGDEDDLTLDERATLSSAVRNDEYVSKDARAWYDNGGKRY